MEVNSTRYAAFAIDGDTGQFRMILVAKEGMSKKSVEDVAWFQIHWDEKDKGWDAEPRHASIQVVEWETAMRQEPYRTALVLSDDYRRLLATSAGDGTADDDDEK